MKKTKQRKIQSMKNAEEKAREFTEDLARTLKSLVGLAMSIEECQTFVNAVVNETMNEYAIDKATQLLEKEREQKPQSSNIDMSDWHFCKVYGFKEGIDKCPNCDQDNVREVDYQKMFANCSLPNETHKLREAATNIIQKWKCKCAITSSDIQKLEEALNQNGLAMCSGDLQ